MKAKTIKSVLRRKIRSWAETIEDPSVRDVVLQSAIVTGGSIASMLLGEKVNDYDVYFKDRDSAFAVADYYVKQYLANRPSSQEGIECYLADDYGQPARRTLLPTELTDPRVTRLKVVVRSSGIATENETPDYEYFETVPDDEAAEEYLDAAMGMVDGASEDQIKEPKRTYRPIWLSSNAITLSDDIQMVIRFWGEPDQIHENYDFAHCTNYWTSWNGELVLKPAALECLLSRELIYQGSKYPVCSLIRTRKFIQRGWRITAAQYLKMCFQVSDLDLTDFNVLEDQMTGVDAAHFQEVLNLYRAEIENAEGKPLDRAYLLQLLERII